MKHFKARKLRNDTWEYTCLVDGENGEPPSIYPVGYCGGWQDWTPDVIADLGNDAYQAHLSRRDKYHTEPHNHEREAIKCFKSYLLDTARFGGTLDPVQACQVCRLPATSFATVGTDNKTFILCSRHLNVDALSRLLVVRESWEH